MTYVYVEHEVADLAERQVFHHFVDNCRREEQHCCPLLTTRSTRKEDIMKLLAFFGLVSAVSAFAPASQPSTSSSALTAVPPEKEIGVLPPVGFFEYVVDPRPLDLI